MKITEKRFAGRNFNAVQVVPLLWRLKWFAVFAVPAVVLFYFWGDMYNAAKAEDGSSSYYILDIHIARIENSDNIRLLPEFRDMIVATISYIN